MPATRFRLNKTAVFIVVFAVALAVRLGFVFQWDKTPYGGEPILDAMAYDTWAQDIAKGHILRATAFYASPLYPYVLGLLYAIFGHDLLIPGLLNAMLGALMAVVLSLFAFEVFGVEAALITGLLTAFDMPLIFYTAPVMKEPLALLLLSLFLLYAARALRQNRMRDYAWSGVFIGLCALTRGNILILAPIFLLFAGMKWRKGALRNTAVFIGLVCLSIAPATVHNYIASRDFVPINYAYGFNLYIGNSPNANGTNNYPPEISSDPLQEERATIWEAQQALGHQPKPSEVSTYWRDRALDYIRHNPLREPALLRNKFEAFWNTTEAVDNYDIDFVRKNFDTLLSWPLAEFWLIAALAGFGAVAAWRERREDVAALAGFIAAYMASVLIFYVTDRYRLPVLVFLLPLAGAAIPYGWTLYRARAWRRIGYAAVLAMFALYLSLRPFPNELDLNAFDWGTLSVIYADEGEDDKSLAALQKGLALSPVVGIQAYVSAALIDQKLGQKEEAERLFKLAIKAYPQSGSLLYNYGRFKALEADIPGALTVMEKAVQLEPSFVLNYYGLAMIYDRLGQHDKAVEAAWHGLALDPHNALLLELLPKLQKKLQG